MTLKCEKKKIIKKIKKGLRKVADIVKVRVSMPENKITQ